MVPVLDADNGSVELPRRSNVGLKLEALCFGDEPVEAPIHPLGVTRSLLMKATIEGTVTLSLEKSSSTWAGSV